MSCPPRPGHPGRRPHDGDHPDMRDNAPGRIPESLIDAAIDGELDPQIQREIGKALEYDPERRQQFHDTRDAINALRIPLNMPDLSDRVLARASRHRKFIPARLRAQVRAGRVGIAALLLAGLLGVASLQRMYPRLTTIASQQTPVHDIQSAVQNDSTQIAQALSQEFNAICSSVAPVASIFDRPAALPGNTNQRFDVSIQTASLAATSSDHYRGFSHTHLSQPGFALLSMMQANERARIDTLQGARQNARYGLLPAESARIVSAAWSPPMSSASLTPDDAFSRGYEVPELP